MKPKVLLRIAAGCLLFFAIGHSAGHFSRHDVTDPKAKEVLQQMIDNKFDMFGQMRSYDENYTGMSLNLIFTLLAFATVLWLMSSNVESNEKLIKSILVPIVLCVFAFSITSFLYFFPVPAVTCLVASVAMVWSYLKL